MKQILPLTILTSLNSQSWSSEAELTPDITRPEIALEQSTQSLADMPLAEVDQKLNPPLTSLWSLTL